MTFDINHHAGVRISQRGFADSFLQLFFHLQDIVIYSHGKECLGVSRNSIEKCLNSKDLTFEQRKQIVQSYNKLLKTIVVHKEGRVITIKHDWSKK